MVIFKLYANIRGWGLVFAICVKIEWNDAGTIFFDLYHEYVFSENIINDSLFTYACSYKCHFTNNVWKKFKFETMLSIKGNDV